MSIKFKPTTVGDFWLIPVQERHQTTLEAIQKMLEERTQGVLNQYTWTAWHPSGVALAICGIGYNYSWAILAEDLRRYMVPITRKVREQLQDHYRTIGPVYAEIDKEYSNAVKWAKVLGFEFDRDGLDREIWKYDPLGHSTTPQRYP